MRIDLEVLNSVDHIITTSDSDSEGGHTETGTHTLTPRQGHRDRLRQRQVLAHHLLALSL